MGKLNLSLGGGSGRSNDIVVSAGLWGKRNRFDAWLGHCFVFFGQNTFLSQYLPQPRSSDG